MLGAVSPEADGASTYRPPVVRSTLTIPGRLVRSARRLRPRLPADWPRAAAFQTAMARIVAIPAPT